MGVISRSREDTGRLPNLKLGGSEGGTGSASLSGVSPLRCGLGDASGDVTVTVPPPSFIVLDAVTGRGVLHPGT